MIVDGILSGIYDELKTNSQGAVIKGPKILVLDADTTLFLAQFMEQNYLLSDEFVLTTTLDRMQESTPFPNLHGVFFVKPAAENIDRIASLLRRERRFFESVYLCFSRGISDDQLLKVAYADVNGMVYACKITSSEFFPVFSNLVLCSDPSRFLEAYNVYPCAIRYQASSEVARRAAGAAVSVCGDLQYSSRGKARGARPQGRRRPVQLVVVSRDVDRSFLAVPPTSFVGLADEHSRCLDGGLCGGRPLAYFMLSRLSRAFYLLDAFESDFQRAQSAKTISQQIGAAAGSARSESTSSGASGGKQGAAEDICRALALQQQSQQISNELINFSQIQRQFAHLQKYLCQISLNMQELIAVPTAEKLYDVLQAWEQALRREALAQQKTEILRYYARAAVAALRTVQTARAAQKRDKAQAVTAQFLYFIEEKAQAPGLFQSFKDSANAYPAQKTDQFKWDIYEQNARAARQEVVAQKIYAQLPKPDYAEYILGATKNKPMMQSLNSVRPPLAALAESAALNKFDNYFAFIGNFESQLAEFEKNGEFVDCIIYVVGGVTLSEVVGTLVHEYCQGKDYEIGRFVYDKVLFVSDRILRFYDVK